MDQVCEAWLASKHSLKPSTLGAPRHAKGAAHRTRSHRDPTTDKGRPGHLDRPATPRRGRRRKQWTPRSCNYPLHLTTAVLDNQVTQGNAVRNVARLVDRVAGHPQKFRTLIDAEMFHTLDHDCRDRHLRALALYGLRGNRWAAMGPLQPDREGHRPRRRPAPREPFPLRGEPCGPR